jgi:hypothetical protein
LRAESIKIGKNLMQITQGKAKAPSHASPFQVEVPIDYLHWKNTRGKV